MNLGFNIPEKGTLDFLSLGLYVAFPEIILWLPNLMSGK